MSLIFIIISFSASVVGAICGIGGGVIIKPALDAFGGVPIATINFLSGCTVLGMTSYSVLTSLGKDQGSIDIGLGVPLGVGSIVGGLCGNIFFDMISSLLPNPDTLGFVQAALLMITVVATMLYTLRKEALKSLMISGALPCFCVGCALGMVSSFLGIGGGPINLMVLSFCFGMDAKIAAQNSLFIILLSQAASTARTLLMGCPVFELHLLLGMIVAGVSGGVAGRNINRRIDAASVDRLFLLLMGAIVLICIYNMSCYLA